MLASAQVKAALATRITGLASTAGRVYKSRAWPLAEADLPAWKVVSQAEDVERLTVHEPMLQRHSLRIDLNGAAIAEAALDDALDTLASEALSAIFNPPALPDALSALGAVQISLTGIDRSMGRDGQAEIGLVTVNLLAEFQTLSSDPDTIVS